MWTYNQTNELFHHGVKGQKWGVRRFQKKNKESYLQKGTIVKRVSISKDDPTYDNKKYVSINNRDHDKWDKYLGEEYLRRNAMTYSQTYITTKDLKVMSSTKQGKLYVDMCLDADFKKQAKNDNKEASNKLGLPNTINASENISRNIAMQTKTGKEFVNRVLKEGYDAVVDTHGKNVSKNPVIVLDADNNLQRYSDPERTKAVEKFLRQYYRKNAIPA